MVSLTLFKVSPQIPTSFNNQKENYPNPKLQTGKLFSFKISRVHLNGTCIDKDVPAMHIHVHSFLVKQKIPYGIFITIARQNDWIYTHYTHIYIVDSKIGHLRYFHPKYR